MFGNVITDAANIAHASVNYLAHELPSTLGVPGLNLDFRRLEELLEVIRSLDIALDVATGEALWDKYCTGVPERQRQISGEIKYRLETSRGDEFLGTKDDVIETFSRFNRKLLKEGYQRRGFRPGTDPDFQSL
ncbi:MULTISPECIES: hypothetical protein [Acidobacteriaceae]|uniref:hypothetical protein n=1 Tax=Acidobacteriaceae TaxID=204434 RepID=UPI00131CC99E|nr:MULTISPECIES: hypothetical protein [Acidobacteriaceae]MDW5266066.1 hypothetical protein [Edaphobacter sp.]